MVSFLGALNGELKHQASASRDPIPGKSTLDFFVRRSFNGVTLSPMSKTVNNYLSRDNKDVINHFMQWCGSF